MPRATSCKSEKREGRGTRDGGGRARAAIIAGVKSKVVESAREAVAAVQPGAAVMVGGFAPMAAWPSTLLRALAEHGAGGLTIIANAVGYGPYSPQVLAERGLVTRFIGSFGGHTGIATAMEQQILAGEVAYEIVPQGTLVERIRAAGAGIAGFYTPTGVGTVIQSPDKEVREFGGRPHLFERALPADAALLRADVADAAGNCRFDGTTRNFQPAMASAAATVIVQAERLVAAGELDPEEVHLPGIFVDAVVRAEIPRAEIVAEELARGRDPLKDAARGAVVRGIPRDLMALRVARMIADYRYVNLGVGAPTLVGRHLQEIGAQAALHAQNGILGFRGLEDVEGWNPSYFDASSLPIAPLPGAALFDSVAAFAMARGGHLDAVVLGAYEVSRRGDLANWSRPGVGAGRIGGAMDLLAGGGEVIALLEHTTRDGRPRIVEECSLPLTGRRCVSTIVTNLALIGVTADGLVLREIAPGVSPAEVAAATGCPIAIPDDPPPMAFD